MKNNKCFRQKATELLFFLIASLAVSRSFASKSMLRMTLGGVGITERYKSDEFGSASNDSLLASGRFFYNISELGEDRWEFTTDLRDKHDFFGKLTKEALALEGKNDFQVRQFSTRWLNPQGSLGALLGRFPLPEAGAVFVDGLQLEYRLSNEWKLGLFGGLNPKSVDKSYLTFNEDAQQQGTFLAYQSKSRGWNNNLFLTHGYVEQFYKKEPERKFFFHNAIFQWAADSRWISFLNYDLVPSAKWQTANLLFQQQWNAMWGYELGYLLIDVLEYRRRQGVLEKIAPSPYHESHWQWHSRFGSGTEVALEISSGQREVDKLERKQAELGCLFSNAFMDNMDFKIKVGKRNNFTSLDSFLHLGLGYFSRKWEYSFDIQSEVNANNDGTTTHPLSVELALTNYYSKQIFLTGSFEQVANENVTITSSFFKLGYRFGNQEIPAVRDGAPPRGPL